MELRVNMVDVVHVDASGNEPLELLVDARQCTLPRIDALKSILNRYHGLCEVRLRISDNDRVFQIACGDEYRVSRDPSMFGELKALFGPSCLG